MFAGADDAGLANRQAVVLDRFCLEPTVEEFVLAENDWVIERDRIDEHVVGIGDGCWGEHDEAWVLRIDAFHALAVEGPGAGSAAGG